MKLIYAAAIVAVAGLVAPASAQTAPASAQTATDTLTQAAKQAATQAAVDGINKTAGTSDQSKGKKAKGDKDGPNWGKSDDHRQDDDHGHKGKNKKNKHN